MDGCSAPSALLTDSLELELGTEWCKPPCFSCAFDNREGKFSGESYLASGALKRLILNLDPLPTNFEEDTVELFGFQWVTETALVYSCRELFHLFRQQIFNLESLLQVNCDFGKIASLHAKADSIRQQCVVFLHYIKVFIFRCLKVQEAESHSLPVHPYQALEAQLPSMLVDELRGLLLYIGHLAELPSVTLGAFVNQNQIKLFPPSWHLLHLYLDTHWLALEILHMLGEKLKQVIYGRQFIGQAGDSLTNVSLFEEHCEHLFCDLICLSVKRYDKVMPSEALLISHYPCSCVKELWVLLIHLLDHRSKWSVSESFWNWLNKLLKTLFEKSSDQRRPSVSLTQTKDPLGFSWWISVHVASLYQIDRHGVADEMRQMESNWSFIEELLKQSVTVQDSILEEQLRMHLHCCLTLCDFWEPNISVVTILWEYYCKNLNSSFSISWLPLKGLTNIIKSPLSMLTLVRNCCCDKQDPDLYKSSSSYIIFLCILAKVVKKAMKNSGPHPWKQVKGRIYSKFHQKRMEELTEVGLQNFFILFLLLAAVAEIEDVASHVLDLLRFLRPASMSAHGALVWKGQMAFLLMYAQKNLDIGVWAEKLSCEFQEKAKEFLVSKNEEMVQRHTLWTLLCIYIDGVQEVFETSCCLHPSHEHLLNDGFSMLLRACRESELRTVLSFLQAVLARIRSVHQQLCQELLRENVDLIVQSSLSAKERPLAAVAGALWRQFFSFLKSQRMTQAVPLSQLADAAADFTLLAVDMPNTAPPDLQPQPVISIIHLFGWDDIIWPQVVARYLSHLLQNSTVCEALSQSSCVSFQSLTIRSWVRCVLQMHIKHLSEPDLLIDVNPEQTVEKEYMEQLAEMTRLLFTLSEVRNIFSKAQIDCLPRPEDPTQALMQFLEAVGMTYRTLQTVSDKSAMVTKSLEYLGEVLKYIKPYLGKKVSSAGLQLTYGIMGILVKSWAQIFATSKAQKLLFRIIDCLLLPHTVLQHDKELPVPMLSALQKTLPLYLQGMCIVCCQSQNPNAYLNQLLRNVIEQYIGRFLPALPCVSDLGQHPVLLALRNPASVPSIMPLRKHTVHAIRKSYLEFKGSSPPPRLASVLAFILQLFKNTEMGVCDLELLLPGIMKCLVLVNEPQVKKLATENLQCMVKTCQVGSEEGPATQLTSLFRQFIQDYGMQYSYQVYSILETVATLSQHVVIQLIPTLTQSLKDSELRWGLGRNIAQREVYSKLLSRLGQVGQDEKRRLESDNL
ncbi:protein MMS22-like isoform X2 [Mastomys coucha]|uniref:protein MMS22-like isoform X2 n=1 Tax=Mastomys coucha TaxID=35658 RepID=UPI0012626097|nr:protein MMS22-like isoform X2 [Mastomys coucha]